MTMSDVKTSKAKSDQGFTLIEVMLALTIVASITVIVWGSIAVSFESRQYMMNSFDQHQQVRLAVDRMSREFSMAFVAAHGNKKDHIPTDVENLNISGTVVSEPEEGLPEIDGEDEVDPQGSGDVLIETAFVGKRDEVHFTSLAYVRTKRNEKTSDQCEIAYFVRNARRRSGDGRLRKELVRREDSTLDDDVEDGGVIYTLIDNVESVKFEFWQDGSEGDEEGGGKWVKDWDSRNFDQKGMLPSRVRISIEVPVDGNSDDLTRTFVTQAPIMMTQILAY
jgi:prepilin-type N-terminal cleavage/methylation domain-containing protein